MNELVKASLLQLAGALGKDELQIHPVRDRLFVFHVNESHALLHTATPKVLHDPLP